MQTLSDNVSSYKGLRVTLDEAMIDKCLREQRNVSGRNCWQPSYRCSW